MVDEDGLEEVENDVVDEDRLEVVEYNVVDEDGLEVVENNVVDEDGLEVVDVGSVLGALRNAEITFRGANSLLKVCRIVDAEAIAKKLRGTNVVTIPEEEDPPLKSAEFVSLE